MNHWKGLIWILCTVRCLWAGGVEVLLDPGDATGAFFLSSPDEPPGGVEAPGPGSEPSRRFALTFSSRITVVAQFGPFSVRQTVYATSPLAASAAASSSAAGNQSAAAMPSSDSPEPMGDVTAHLVTPAPRRDQPTLRILFHTGSEVGGPSVCVALYAQLGAEQLVSVCQPNRDGACLAELTLPAAWWPPLWATAHKAHRPTIALRYALVRSTGSPQQQQECQGQSLRLSVPPPSAASPPGVGLSLGRLPLSVAHGSYEELSGGDGVVCLLVPQGPVYPRSKVYVPLLVRPNPAYPLHVFVIRAKVKPGLRILQVQPTARQSWNVAVDTNSKHTSATVTVTRINEDTAPPESGEEVLNWLFEVEEGVSHEDGGQMTFHLRYLDALGAPDTATVGSSSSSSSSSSPLGGGGAAEVGEDSIRLTSRLDIQKDDVQAVLLVAKSSQLLNTAVLTGKQVSQPMKVFVVSQSGLLGDVTLQSSCHSADESILKVSPSCTSVYLDGSEVRGSQNATVLVKYGTYTGQAAFLVWMPELPLDLRLSDSKLSQVRAWRTPHRDKRCRNSLLQGTADCRGNWLRNKRRIPKKWDWQDPQGTGPRAAAMSPSLCRLRFQQARVEVLTRFQSVDHNSGREAYLLGRRTQVAVTRLVAPFLRVADSHLAALHGTTVRGLRAGRTEVQVLSPITGKVLGASELRVSTDKESLVRLEVQLVTGLALEVLPDEGAPGVFVARTSTSQALTSLYQEGLLDVTLRFSDGTWTPLTDVAESDFSLLTESLDPGVVALAPAAPSSGGLAARPRIVAIGQGQGSLLQLSLEVGEACQRRRRGAPLAWARARVNARFASSMGGGGGGSLDAVPYQDGARPHHQEPSIQAQHNRAALSADGSRGRGGGGVLVASPLELGLYALLGVLGLAAAVMVTGCTVLAVKYQKHPDLASTAIAVQPTAAAAPSSSSHPRRPVSSAHDWVWLGRATLERSSVNTRCSQALVAPEDHSKSPPSSLPHAPASSATATTNTAPLAVGDLESGVKRVGGAQPRIRTNPMLTFTRPPPVPPHRTTSRNSPATDSLQEVPLLGHTANGRHHQRALSPHVRIQSPASFKTGSSSSPAASKTTSPPSSKTTSPDSKSTTSPASKASSPDTKTTSPGGGSKTTSSPESKSGSPGGVGRGILPAQICKVVKARASGKPGSTLEWEDVTKGMNYDQLVEYFDSLKESSA